MSDSLSRSKLARAACALQRNSRKIGPDGLPSAFLFCDDDRLPDPVAAAKTLLKDGMDFGVIVRTRAPARRAVIAGALTALPITVLIAGDTDLARRLGCGLHLPEVRAGEISRWRARSGAPVTLATHSMCALTRAARFGASAAFLSPVFPTKSHPGAPALGLMRAVMTARAAPLPVYALGGICGANAGRLTGFCGLAAIGALIPGAKCPCQSM